MKNIMRSRVVVSFSVSPDVVSRIDRLAEHLRMSRSKVTNDLLNFFVPLEADKLPSRRAMRYQPPRDHRSRYRIGTRT